MAKNTIVFMMRWCKMKANYTWYFLLISIILFRNSFLTLTINLTSNWLNKDENLELKVLKSQNEYLTSEVAALLDFKNNIVLDYDYTITNIIKNHYGFSTLSINGTNYKVGDEAIINEGLVGIVSKIQAKTAELDYIYNTDIVVSINNETGKIMDKDQDNNLIVKEISNYNNIKINDLVYSTYGTYIGKVIKIKYGEVDDYLTVKTINLDNLNYVAIIRR